MTIQLELRSGERYSFAVPSSVPARRAKSWAMGRMPYGTDFYHCRWGVSA